jgi:hypothetical protein
MLALCALPYGCGGKAVQDDRYRTPTVGAFQPGGDGAPYSVDGGPNYGDGYYVSRDGSYNPVAGAGHGDGAFPPFPDGGYDGFYTQGDGESPYGDCFGCDGYDRGEGADGDSTPPSGAVADGAAPEGAADGWAK